MTEHTMGLAARRLEANKLFAAGYSNVEVASELRISVATASRYKKVWLEALAEEAAESPDLLRQVLPNTIRTLTELDALRAKAMTEFDAAQNGQTRAAFLNISARLLDQRAKLLGLMGVKQDVLLHIGQVRDLQTKILNFLERELCAKDRAKLDAYLIAEFGDQIAAVATVDDLLAASRPSS